MNQYDISIIIPTIGRFSSLKRALNSIFSACTNDLKVEILVVCNLHCTITEKYIQELQPQLNTTTSVKYAHNTVVSVNAARNMGVKLAKSEILYFLDDDIQISKNNQLSFIIDYFKKNPLCAALGGGYLFYSQASVVEKTYCLLSNEFVKNINHSFKSNPFLLGGNSAYNKTILNDFLIFNEDIKFGATESELNLRLVNAGFNLRYMSELDVYHDTILNLKLFLKKGFLQGIGRKKIDSLFLTKEPILQKTFEQVADWKIKMIAELYNLAFSTGYRVQSQLIQKSHLQIDTLLVIKSFLFVFFQIHDQYSLLDDHHKPYHQQHSFTFKGIYHWAKAHLFWKFRVFILWQLFPTIFLATAYIACLFQPFDIEYIRFNFFSIGLRFENGIKKLFASR